MRMLSAILKAIVHAPVEDHTGLTGKYDIHVKWSRDDGTGTASANSASLPNVEPSVTLFAALKAQL